MLVTQQTKTQRELGPTSQARIGTLSFTRLPWRIRVPAHGAQRPRHRRSVGRHRPCGRRDLRILGRGAQDDASPRTPGRRDRAGGHPVGTGAGDDRGLLVLNRIQFGSGSHGSAHRARRSGKAWRAPQAARPWTSNRTRFWPGMRRMGCLHSRRRAAAWLGAPAGEPPDASPACAPAKRHGEFDHRHPA